MPSAAACFSVSLTGSAAMAPASVSRAAIEIADEGGGEKRTGRIMDQHAVRPIAAQRLEPGQHRGLARGAAGHGGAMRRPAKGAAASSIEGGVLGIDDDHRGVDLRVAGQHAQRVGEHRLARKLLVLFGHRAAVAARVPRPAATISATVVVIVAPAMESPGLLSEIAVSRQLWMGLFALAK